MEEDRPSRTAEGAAIQRALHQTLDEEPKILDDPVATRLLDSSSDFYKSYVEGFGANAGFPKTAAPGKCGDVH